LENGQENCEKTVEEGSKTGEANVSDLDVAKKARDEVTKQLGDIVRQLAFAGIAVVWIIKSEPVKSGIEFEPALYWPLFWLVVTLTLDLAYYLWASVVWDNISMIWSARKSPKSAADDMPGWFNHLNIPTRVLLYAKTASVVFAYFVLIGYVWDRVPKKKSDQPKPIPAITAPR
jgi:hypothetical protein